MKVGDIVRCITADGRIGIIAEVLDPKGWKRYAVLVVGYDLPGIYDHDNLEVIG